MNRVELSPVFVHTIAISVVDAAGYQTDTIVIDGVECTFTSDKTPTTTEIATGLKAAIAASSVAGRFTVSGTTSVVLTPAGAFNPSVSVSKNLTDVITVGTLVLGSVVISSITAGDNNIGNVDVASLPSLPAGSNNIGDVDVASMAALIAGEAHIGETGGWSDLIKVTPTITVGAYSAQDMVGGKLTLTNAMRVVGGKGYLYSLEVIDTDKIAAALDIHLFSAMAGAYADNGAESISAADALNHLGLIRILATDYLTKANFSIAQPDPSTFKPIVLKSGAASRDLFAIVVCVATPTYTHVGGLQFNFGIIGD